MTKETADQDKLLSAIHTLCTPGLSQAAHILSVMTKQSITLHHTGVHRADACDVGDIFPQDEDEPMSRVSMCFDGAMRGQVSIYVPQQTVRVLINTFTQSNMRSFEMDVFRVGMVTEVSNIMMNGFLSGLTAVHELMLDYESLQYEDIQPNTWQESPVWEHALYAGLTLDVSSLELPAWVITCLDGKSLPTLERLLLEGMA